MFISFKVSCCITLSTYYLDFVTLKINNNTRQCFAQKYTANIKINVCNNVNNVEIQIFINYV